MTNIPQPKPTWLIGNVPDLDRRGLVQSLMQLAREHGPIYRLQLPYEEFVVLSSQKLVDEICNEKLFDKKIHRALEELRKFVGDSLFTARTDEKNWTTAHHILAPAFGPAALRVMFEGIMDIAEQMLLKWEREGEDVSINVPDNMTRFTLDSIALCGFDYRFNSFYKDEPHPFVQAMVRALTETLARIQRLPIQTKLMIFTQHQFSEDAALQHHFADQLIAARRKTKAGARRDLLDVMLEAKDPQTGERLSDENIRYQIVNFLVTGHETTSALLSFSLYFLLENPDVLVKLREEADRVFAGEAPRFEHISQLVYADQVLKESLRLYPTAPVFAVRSLQPKTTLADGYEVTSDQVICALLPMLHRDPDVWGADTEAFNPERFTAENYARLPPNSWKPFGNGQRACIGRPFAMMEATLGLALIAHRFEISKADADYKLKVKETLSWKPDQFFIRAKKRDVVVPASKSTVKTADPAPAPQARASAAPANGVPIRVLFGSNGGSAESFAHKIATQASLRGYAATIETLDEAADLLPHEGAVLVVTASYEGHPTDDARKFIEWLDQASAGSLTGVKFAVFGCGNSDWSRTYQAVPRKIDARLAELGAARLSERGEADAHGDFFGDFDRWFEPLWDKLDKAFGVKTSGAAPVALLSVAFVEECREQLIRRDDFVMAEIVENRELADLMKPAIHSVRHIEIALPQGSRFRAGDYLSVLPTNPPENVDRVLKRFGLSSDAQIEISTAGGLSTFLPTGRPVGLKSVISTYVELCAPATRAQIEQLAASTPCPPEQARLRALIADDDVFAREALEKRLSVLDLLERTPSCVLPFASFLQMLPPLKPRRYSISSSPAWNDERCAITVSVLEAPALSGNGAFRGCASTFLAHATPGTQIPVSLRESNAAFHPPDNPETPIVMVAAGTGIAPFRGFLQDRAAVSAAKKQKCGEALLFFGCDSADANFLYHAEFAEWESRDLVHVRPAFSKESGSAIHYVQDRVWQDRDDVARLIDQGARIYVCGDGRRMAPAVRETFGRIRREISQSSQEEADAWLAELEKSVRYVQDVFA